MSPEYKHICKALSFRGKRLQRVGKVFFTIFAKKQIRTTRGRPYTSECQRGGHETCTLWPPPAPFGYFPARGKYLVRPQEDETSHKELISCGRQGKASSCFFCFAKGFASAEATKGLSGRPLETFGVPPLERDGGYKKWIFCGRQGKAPPCFFVSLRVSPLRRRPKGFPIALWKPSGFHPLRGMGATKNGFFVEGRGKPRLAFLVLHRVSLLQGNYDQTVNNRQEINKTAKFVDFSASPRDQSIARGWQKFL